MIYFSGNKISNNAPQIEQKSQVQSNLNAIHTTTPQDSFVSGKTSSDIKTKTNNKNLTAYIIGGAVLITGIIYAIRKRNILPAKITSKEVSTVKLKEFNKEEITDNYLTYLNYAPKESTIKYMNIKNSDGKTNLEQLYGGDFYNIVTQNGEMQNQPKYTNLLLNLLDNPSDTKKLNETGINLSKKYDELSDKIRTSLSNLPASLKINAYNISKIDSKGKLSPEIKVFVLRDIMKKKYYVINNSASNSEKYSLKDPFTSQEAREEIIDTHLGWDLLNQADTSQDFKNPQYASLLDKLQEKMTFSKEETDLFKKLSNATVTSGSKSEVHSYELKNLGKIIREKFNITVD